MKYFTEKKKPFLNFVASIESLEVDTIKFNYLIIKRVMKAKS